MGQLGESKMLFLDARHPGLIQKVDAMFAAFETVDAVTAMIRTEYGERINRVTVWNYKRRFWNVQHERDQAARAAYQELRNEGRN